MNAAAKRDRLHDILKQSPVVAVITIDNVSTAVPLARALVAGGVRALEMTLRTPVAMAAAAAVAKEVPDAILGVGTILTPDDLAAAIKVGAHFGVSPGITLPLLDAAAQGTLPFLPGVATASELIEAQLRGFGVVKLFPASSVGMSTARAFAGPFPNMRFCPTGGVDESNFMEWLAVPNVIAVGGSWLARKADIESGNWDVVTGNARRAMARVAGR
ncbi:MAG: bifunctional 4-hydroxy-2-oxoglutarate aldolase/2-dehydro-3-deoxy-phosphogluconate aldolase [Pseudolabrys sp.]|nr:bifunctional 4-hydroxy-2-oxoglutarate aldolase/2-dehydro-3-deoxy-phosphogluconate aldolase [Pseudolabrys sp.]